MRVVVKVVPGAGAAPRVASTWVSMGMAGVLLFSCAHRRYCEEVVVRHTDAEPPVIEPFAIGLHDEAPWLDIDDPGALQPP